MSDRIVFECSDYLVVSPSLREVPNLLQEGLSKYSLLPPNVVSLRIPLGNWKVYPPKAEVALVIQRYGTSQMQCMSAEHLAMEYDHGLLAVMTKTIAGLQWTRPEEPAKYLDRHVR